MNNLLFRVSFKNDDIFHKNEKVPPLYVATYDKDKAIELVKNHLRPNYKITKVVKLGQALSGSMWR